MGRIGSEQKIIGRNLPLLSAVLAAALTLLAVSAGELLNVGWLGCEVVWPFFAATAVGEWGRTRSDANYDAIAAQSRDLFGWVSARYAAVFGTVSAFAAVGMIPAALLRRELPYWEMLAVYLLTAFFLSSLSALVGVFCRQEHAATLVCGVLWLAMLMSESTPDKAVLALLGAGMWGIIRLKLR